MGSAQSCQLDQVSNLCDMHQCISKVQGKASNSASPTDTWLCTLKPNTTFNGQPCSHTFMKIGINNATKAAAALTFECLVYDRLIVPILDAQMCPHFLRSYLVSTSCTYSDLEKTLRAGLSDLDDRQRAINLHRNLTYMEKKEKRRPAIQKITPRQAFVPKIASHLVPNFFMHHRFIVISTEYSQVQTYRDWVSREHLSSAERFSVLLQILIALQVMSFVKLMHNDLHTSNILIRQHPPQVMTYIIHGLDRPVSILTTHTALVFDFDHATCKALGVNKGMSQDRQQFQDKRDLVCFYKNVTRNVRKQDMPQVCLDDLNALFRTRPFTLAEIERWSVGDGNDIEPSIAAGIQSIAEMLEKTLPPIEAPFGPKANVYYATPKMLLPNGNFNRSSADHILLDKCMDEKSVFRNLQISPEETRHFSKKRRMEDASTQSPNKTNTKTMSQ